MSISNLATQIKSGKKSAASVVTEALEKAAKYSSYNIFTSLNKSAALSLAKKIDRKIAAGEPVGALAGVPFAVKDNILSPDGHTTASSKMLESFTSPITATAIKKLQDQDAILIGRTNLDAFGHGSSTENSYFGPTLNAHDKSRVAGGSSGGSAVAVALDIVPFALGTDTGSSIRLPAAYNGVYGFKPTYGAVSRYGVIAMVSSTDTVGCLTKHPADVDTVMSILSGQDPADSTTLPDFYDHKTQPIQTIGVITDFGDISIDPEITKSQEAILAKLQKSGCRIKELSMPTLRYALPVYSILSAAEITSNFYRFDGIRYGHRSPSARTLTDIYVKSRNEGLMPENKLRIMFGNFVLATETYEDYFVKAQKVRTLIINEYAEAFQKVDAIITPVAPTPAFKLGAKSKDPAAMLQTDALCVPVALAGLPAIAIPAGQTKSGLPIGLQIIGPRRADRAIINLAQELAS